ncbi:nucleotidyltransferase family protein [Streptococcus massiliensis]|uniref:Uncharacterized protein conserved in bacteria n=1 Tax=Streptococcus massiliensis TaxID=313439 RepID=A0A380KYF2_9STRE|nr:nucleotidyltransferase family protein [Streptococcus massiliensis]SUN72178.1 Uncharacterized protein conserved in bacteria [Streptococcus massiliensis]SUN77013.1 Uncharacterized protein conserved in bacteria [Streptococcus massiliensis]
MTKSEILKQLVTDPHIKEILEIIQSLQLNDSWLCAGTIRNYIWNVLTDKLAFDEETDVDVIFYDPAISYEETLILEKRLQTDYPQYKWELKNQVYMHVHSPETQPYTDSRDAMSKYPERCTAVGLRLTNQGEEFYCPYGWEEIFQMEVHPTPHFRNNPQRLQLYQTRQLKKRWQDKWQNLKIFSE